MSASHDHTARGSHSGQPQLYDQRHHPHPQTFDGHPQSGQLHQSRHLPFPGQLQSSEERPLYKQQHPQHHLGSAGNQFHGQHTSVQHHHSIDTLPLPHLKYESDRLLGTCESVNRISHDGADIEILRKT